MALRNWPDVPDMPDKDAGEPPSAARGDQRTDDQRITDRDPEAPEADVAEQVASANPADDTDDDAPPTAGTYREAAEYDTVEQHRTVAYDDDYR